MTMINNQYIVNKSDILSNVLHTTIPLKPDYGLMRKRLKAVRCNDLQMTQADAAEEIGITASALSKYENGVYAPSNGTIRQIAKVYGVNYLWLSGVSNDKYEDVDHEQKKQPVNKAKSADKIKPEHHAEAKKTASVKASKPVKEKKSDAADTSKPMKEKKPSAAKPVNTVKQKNVSAVARTAKPAEAQVDAETVCIGNWVMLTIAETKDALFKGLQVKCADFEHDEVVDLSEMKIGEIAEYLESAKSCSFWKKVR